MKMSELQNFVNKFHQLRQAGFTAHLDRDAHAGQAWVCLHLMPEPKHRSPSYLKRQERRKAAWLAAGNSRGYSDVVKASEAKITEEVSKNSEDYNIDSNEESLNLQLSSLSSHNGSEMEVASSSLVSDFSLSLHAAVSSSPKNADPVSKIRNEKSDVTESSKDTKAAGALPVADLIDSLPSPNAKHWLKQLVTARDDELEKRRKFLLFNIWDVEVQGKM